MARSIFGPGGKAVRDTANDVKIHFLIAGGDYPGDGKPKPVAFPAPADAVGSGSDARFRIVALPRLIELKLASAMSAPHRGRDFFDVVDLVKHAELPQNLRDQLDPYVRTKFDEVWNLAQHPEEDY